jgi:hypothetical protein
MDEDQTHDVIGRWGIVDLCYGHQWRRRSESQGEAGSEMKPRPGWSVTRSFHRWAPGLAAMAHPLVRSAVGQQGPSESGFELKEMCGGAAGTALFSI